MEVSLIHPNVCYDAIKTIEDDMELYIHNIVWKYGKRKETKKYGVHYELSTYQHKDYAKVHKADGSLLRIKKIVISNPEKCQRMGHLWMIGDDGERYSFLELSGQQFNVYSPIFRKYIKESVK